MKRKKMTRDRFDKFNHLTFEKFEEMASDENLSASEKIGFPDEMRDQYNAAILSSICGKVPAFNLPGTKLIDIGIGCGDLGKAIVQNSIEKSAKGHK